jgi:Fe-S cluster assembly iron-binding protein IscA
LALDESKEDDTEYKAGAFSFIMDPSIVRTVRSFGSVVIDYVDSFFGKGFKVSLRGATSC